VYTLYEGVCILMKKDRKQLWINEPLWFRIDQLLKTHPHHPLLNYRSKTEFVEKTIQEKLDEIRNKLILEKIASSGLESIVTEVKDMRKMIAGGEAFSARWEAKMKKRKKKHTPRVYSPKKK